MKTDIEIAQEATLWPIEKVAETIGLTREELFIKMDSVSSSGSNASGDDDRDELFEPAGSFVIESDKASIGSLQRKFKIGFNRAARIMDQLSDAGVVGPEEGTKPRQILMNMSQFDDCVNY